jgi:hypothetical protein
MAYKVPPLRFAYDALEPYPHLADLTIEHLLSRLDQVPEAMEILGPKAGDSPKDVIADAITKDVSPSEPGHSLRGRD